MAIWLIIPAAGVGKRFGADTPKQYQLLFDKTILEHTLARFTQRDDIAGIVLVVAANDEWLAQCALSPAVHIVHGGKERVDSVKAGLLYLQKIAKDDDLIAVHDAARPCVRQSLLNRLFAQAHNAPHGVLPVQMVKETVKKVLHGKVQATIDRDVIALAQTPQVFPMKLLQEALQTSQCVTDESSAVELLGFHPQVIMGDSDNIKITLAQDLPLAENFLRQIIKEQD